MVKHDEFGYKIDTPDDWWELVNEKWAEVYSILDRFLPLGDHTDIEGKVRVETLGQIVTTLKEARERELCRYFHAAWAAAPDNRSLDYIPSWNVLCELCSEESALDFPQDVSEMIVEEARLTSEIEQKKERLRVVKSMLRRRRREQPELFKGLDESEIPEMSEAETAEVIKWANGER